MVKQRVVFRKERLPRICGQCPFFSGAINWPGDMESVSERQLRCWQSNKENSTWTKAVGGAPCLETFDAKRLFFVFTQFARMDYECNCTDDNRYPNAILYNILRQTHDDSVDHNLNYSFTPHRCHCEMRRTVCLKTPEETCKIASDVLVKTINFMKSLPAFHQLPSKDQVALLHSCWAPLFILGLAQERVRFEVTDNPAASMLKRILLNCQDEPDVHREQPTQVGVNMLKSCLMKFWSLDLSPKEYAYLKGTMIFNPDVPDLRAALFVEDLQQQAQHALREVLLPLHPNDRGRFARILLTASSLKGITPSLIIELFFRPVIGQADLLELLTDMLFSR